MRIWIARLMPVQMMMSLHEFNNSV